MDAFHAARIDEDLAPGHRLAVERQGFVESALLIAASLPPQRKGIFMQPAVEFLRQGVQFFTGFFHTCCSAIRRAISIMARPL